MAQTYFINISGVRKFSSKPLPNVFSSTSLKTAKNQSEVVVFLIVSVVICISFVGIHLA
jgi:hypothetical protein